VVATLRESYRAARRRQILDAAWDVARGRGIGGLTLREVADRVGMRAPSLYEHFPSKDALYDAMFADGYEAFLGIMPGPDDPADLRPRAAAWLRRFFHFCGEDVARYQLLFQPAVPGFHPSSESMSGAARAEAILAREFARFGISRQEARDLWTALVTGMANQQIANDAGGSRWERLAEEAVDMFVDHALRMEGADERADD
jgi:AcrR family transcriptional regulator